MNEMNGEKSERGRSFHENQMQRTPVRSAEESRYSLKFREEKMVMKRKKKVLSLILAVMLLCGVTIPLTAMEANAATHTIVFQGRISIPGSSTTVGKFMVDGQRAFCLEHTELAPPNGATTTSEIYNDPNIAKVLYYGWTGPEQWSGFKNEDHGIMITSLVLAYYYGALGGDYSYLDGWDGFMAYIKSKPIPPDKVVKFNKGSANVRWDVKKQKQITETVTITGDAGDDLTFTVPTGAELVKADGSRLTGSVTLKVGDKFHFEAPASVNGTWSSGNVGKVWKYQPLLFKASGAWQDLGQIRRVQDPAAQTSLSVKWLDFGGLEVRKVDEQSQLLDGMKFNLLSADSATGYGEPGVEYEVKDGKLSIENIPVSTYMLTEVVSPDHHDKPVKNFQVIIEKGKTTEQIVVNRLKPTGEVIIKKTDKDTGEPIQGVEFTLYANDTIYDSISFEKVYDKDQKIATAVTDENGEARFETSHMGKYKTLETKAAEGYIPNKKEYEFEFRQLDYTTKIYTHEIDVTNEKTEVSITKVDSLNAAELPGAELSIRDVETKEIIELDGEKLEWISTEEPHVIKGLTYGKKYILHEDLAPAGYDLAQDIVFTVGEENNIVMKDVPQIGYIEMDDNIKLFGAIMTGDSMKIFIPVMLAILALCSAAAVFTTKQKKIKRICKK